VGHHDEKVMPAKMDEPEEEEEDMDALIEELESQDAAIDYDDEEEVQAGAARVVPEELLQTDTRVGLTTAEVANRVKKYGLNQMKGACACLLCIASHANTSQRSKKT
jgi:H+-transporting ATPase